MRKVVVGLGFALAAIIGLLVAVFLLLLVTGRSRFNETYEIEVSPITLPSDEAALARGEHLVSAVAHCAYCHGEGLAGDIVAEGGPEGSIVAPNLTGGAGGIGADYTTEDWVRTLRHGAELAGGQACGDCPTGPNLTPGGELRGWTQDDFVTDLRTGTTPTGRQLSEFMPWQYFQNMTDTELAALWAYLQSQPARETALPSS